MVTHQRLEGRTALVTGGARGIGEAIVSRLASEGAAVVVADIDHEAARETADRVAAPGSRTLALALDVTREDEWTAAVESTLATFGGLDILVNNAGIATASGSAEERYRSIVGITQDGVFLGHEATADALAASRHGTVVNISSIHGITGSFVYNPGYAAAKGAVRIMSKNYAVAWGPRGVRVNSVHPGFTATPMLAGIPSEASDEWKRRTPLGRLARPEDIAAAVAFLASDDAAFVTGAELVVDGGYTVYA